MRRAGGIEIHIVPGEEARQSCVAASEAAAEPAGAWTRTRSRARFGRLRRRGRRRALRRSQASQPVDDLSHRGAVQRRCVWDTRAAVFASLASFAAYNFFFIQPIYTFTVAQPQELFALLIFLAVAVLTGSLTGRVRDQREMRDQER